MAKSTSLQVKNKTGSTIPANKLVYITGKDEVDLVPTVDIASNTSGSRMPAVGITREEIANEELGEVRVSGLVSGFDTKGRASSSSIYVGKNGAIVFANPDNGTNIVQRIGLVVSPASEPDGQIFLFPLDVTVKHAQTHEIDGSDEIDHNNLNGLNEDGHKIYSLVDGSRAFTGAVEGITPTQPSHLVTKQYVDGLGQVVSTTFNSAADGYVAFFLNERHIAGDNDFFWDRANQRLGIGTSSPTQALFVAADSDPRIVLSENGNTDSLLRLEDTSANISAIEKVAASGNSTLRLNALPTDNVGEANIILFRDTNTSGNRDFSISRGDGTSTTDHRLSSDTRDSFLVRGGGNLGIGTNTPTSFKLQVDGYVGPNVDNVYGLGSPSLRWQSLSVGPGSIHLVSTAAETGVEQDWILGIKTEGGAGNFHISKDGANYLTISPSGSVSIPSISNAHFITLTNANPVQISRIGETTQQVVNIGVDDSSVQFYHIQDEAASNYKFRCHALTGPTDRTMHLDSDAASMRLGVGAQTVSGHHIIMGSRACTTTGEHSYIRVETTGATHGETGLELKAGSVAGSTIWYHSRSDDTPSMLRLWINSSDRMRITSAGFVSIGDAFTSALRLHVRDNSPGNPVFRVENTGDSSNRHGMQIMAGDNDGVTGTTDFIQCQSGDGSIAVGAIRHTAGAFAAVDLSDRSVKKEIAPSSDSGLQIIENLQVSQFKYHIREKESPKHRFGFVAQDCEAVFPEMVEVLGDKKGTNKIALIPVLVKAIQEQQEIINTLISRIEELENN